MESVILREPQPTDNRVVKLAEDLREVRWVVESLAADMHRQADLLIRAFRRLERGVQQLAEPPAESS